MRKRPLAVGARRAACAAAIVALSACGSSSGGDARATDDGGAGPAPVDAGRDVRPSGAREAGPVADAAPDAREDAEHPVHDVDDCTVKSGALAWVASIPATSSTLVLDDIAVAPNNDVLVSDQTRDAYEQRRWSESGSSLGVHSDPFGAYPGKLWTSNLVVDANDDVFYGMLRTGLVSGANLGAQLVFTLLSPTGDALFTDATEGMAPASDGPPKVLLFDTGFDSGGGLHGAFVMTGATPAFGPGVYCYGSTGSYSGTSASSATSPLGATDFEWPSVDEGLVVTRAVTASTDLGCGLVTVPSGGGVILAKLDGGGGCTWNKLLNIPTAGLLGLNFRLGADASLALAVVYSGTIDLGGGPLKSAGKSALAVAHYDSTGALLYAKSFGGAGSAFTIGSVGANVDGTLVVTAGYSGTVDLGGVALPASNDTLLATFDSNGAVGWSRAVTVGGAGALKAAVGKCALSVATNSPTVDLGSGPLSTASAGEAASIGVAALGL